MKFSQYIFVLSFCLIAITACQVENNQQTSTETDTAAGLLQHNVYFYLHDDATPEDAEAFEDGLRELMQISEIYSYELGIPAATEERDVTDHSFAYAIFSWFETLEDYDVYAIHPDHLHFIDTYSHLWANVRVYDSQIIE